MSLIDVDEYIKEINKRIKEAIKWCDECRTDEIKIRAEQAIATFCEASLTAKKMPTIEIEPVRHGKWIDGYGMVRCSECGHKFFKHNYQSKWKYCPNCGAKMHEVEE